MTVWQRCVTLVVFWKINELSPGRNLRSLAFYQAWKLQDISYWDITQDRITQETPETSGMRWVSTHGRVNVDTGLMDGEGKWNKLQPERVLICLGKCIVWHYSPIALTTIWADMSSNLMIMLSSIILEGSTFNLIRDLEIPRKTLNISSTQHVIVLHFMLKLLSPRIKWKNGFWCHIRLLWSHFMFFLLQLSAGEDYVS